MYCPVHAITVVNKKAWISDELCTECGNCRRNCGCRKDAIYQQPLEFPRTVRALLSDVRTVFRGVNGRGTEEMKTNDVTGRFKSGYCGVAIELGRPGVSSTMRDLEKIAKVVAAHHGKFEECNPISQYIVNKETGEVDPAVLDERVLSGIIEVSLEVKYLEEMIRALTEAAKGIDTVFSLDVACLVEKDGRIPTKEIFDESGIWYRPNGKTNLGLGKPFCVQV
jgi:hypothetical protein